MNKLRKFYDDIMSEAYEDKADIWCSLSDAEKEMFQYCRINDIERTKSRDVKSDIIITTNKFYICRDLFVHLAVKDYEQYYNFLKKYEVDEISISENLCSTFLVFLLEKGCEFKGVEIIGKRNNCIEKGIVVKII